MHCLLKQQQQKQNTEVPLTTLEESMKGTQQTIHPEQD